MVEVVETPLPVNTPGSEHRGVVVLGAHGGAGASTVAELLSSASGPVYDLGPVTEPGGAMRVIRPEGRPIILVARNTVIAVEAAANAMTGLRQQGLVPSCLVVVSDGVGAEPREARVRLRLLQGHTDVLRVSFIPALRASTAMPALDELPKKAHSEISEINEVARKAQR